VRYKPAIARYKVYIIDEVHMLSKAAFNGLLKTLEEPPEHVKFIFATTEIRKVPVTVLSRCQRFDLRRIEASRLVGLMKGIAAKEAIEAEDAALAMIARAAEGSARDALSLMDQAIAHTSGAISAAAVVRMLGLADRALIIDLFEEVMRGDVAAALARLKQLYDVGADPAVVLEELAAFTHLVTRLKLAPSAGEDDAALTEEEKARGKVFAEKLSVRVLARAWQMLLKGIAETREAPRPLAAADMVIVRLAYAADLPTVDEAIRSLGDGGAGSRPREASPPAGDGRPRMAMGGGGRPSAVAQPSAPPVEQGAPREVPRLETFADLVALVGEKRELKLKHALETNVRPVRFEPGQIEIALTGHADPTLAGTLSKKLEEWTGARWMIAVAREGGAPTIAEVKQTARAQLVDDARADPLVSAVFEHFPGAEIVDVRVPASADAPPRALDADLPPPDDFSDEDE
jgi:DNA polymerase-3 subunit gamma/tau